METTAVAVLADGETKSDISNRRGHLLESFVAQLLSTQGYGETREEWLNVTKEGIELDVVAYHRVTRTRIICECKAYSSNIRVPMLTSFLGKFSLERADDPSCQGLFVGLPRLTPEAREKAAAAEKKLDGFRYLGSHELCSLLRDAELLPSLSDGPELSADPTLVITEHGLALAACELDELSRRPLRWVVWAKSGVPPVPLLSLVERFVADGLPVSAHGSSAATSIPVKEALVPRIVEVQGSSSDFEYQLPAAPEFFVGRSDIVARLKERTVGPNRSGSIVINAKSGWGKSSLSLFLQARIHKEGGASLVVDTRTAEAPDFVTAALEHLVKVAAGSRLLQLTEAAAFSSVQSVIETLRASDWGAVPKPILIVFDQFENAFRSHELTREFRNLAYLVKDLESPLSVAFCWKTDIVGLTEGFPYGLRDDIREASFVVSLEPFGPREVETLLRRLEKAVGAKLHKELRQRLREYSQGLPWLLKKLAGHIIAEIGRGATQEELVRQWLNVQSLFESDLSRLSLTEQEALRNIARSAPVLVSELDDAVVPNDVLASLLHQRLIVQVGDRLDTYWDTFRDFLNTGRVAIEDSFIVRYAPSGPGKLLRTVVDHGGEMGVPDAAHVLGTSATVVFNYARELRLFGILTTEPNHLIVEPDVLGAGDREEEVRRRVAQSLRRHKMHSIALNLMQRADGPVPLADFADALPSEFPTVAAKPASWQTYARCYCLWLEYAGFIELRRDGMVMVPDSDEQFESATRLLSGAMPVRVQSGFPGGSPGPALELLRHVSSRSPDSRPSAKRFRRGLRELLLLGAVVMDSAGRVSFTDDELVFEGRVDARRLRLLVERQPGMRDAFSSLEQDPGCPPAVLGEAHRERLGAEWASSTTNYVGKYIRAWARACGLSTRIRSGGSVASSAGSGGDSDGGSQESLFA